MARIFISYAREDKDIAKELQHRLLVRRHDVFLDIDGILGGAKWEKELVKRAKWCDVLVILATASANESRWVFREFREAEKNEKIIVPIQVNGAGLREYLEDLNAVPLRYIDSENNSFDNVILRLEDVIPRGRPFLRTRVFGTCEAWAIIIAAIIAGIFAILAAYIADDNNTEKTPTTTISAVSQLETEDASATENVPVASNPTNTNTPTSESIPIPTRPSLTPRPTNTPSITPTSTPNPVLVYEEDFEEIRAIPWSIYDGRWEIIKENDDNNAYLGTNAWAVSRLVATGSSHWKNYIVELRFKIIEFANFGILVRRAGEVGYYAHFYDDNGGNLVLIAMRKDYGGLPLTNPISVPNILEAGEWIDIRISIIDNKFTVTLKNNEYSAYDFSFGEGSLEFVIEEGGTILFDDIRIWSLDESQ